MVVGDLREMGVRHGDFLESKIGTYWKGAVFP